MRAADAALFEDFLVVSPAKTSDGLSEPLLYAYSKTAASDAVSATVEARTAAVVQFCFPESADTKDNGEKAQVLPHLQRRDSTQHESQGITAPHVCPARIVVPAATFPSRASSVHGMPFGA